MAKFKYKTSDKYDAPKGFLDYCADAYLQAAQEELRALASQQAAQADARNELSLAEYLLDCFFEEAEEYRELSEDTDKFETYLYKFDQYELWRKVFLQQLIFEYVSKNEIRRRQEEEGFNESLLYDHLEDLFMRRYCFKVNSIPTNFLKQGQSLLDFKKKLHNNIYVGDVKLPLVVAERVLLGAKFRKETGLRFVSEDQGLRKKIMLFRDKKFLWGEVI